MAKTRAMAGRVAFVAGVFLAIIAGMWGGASVPTSDGANWILLTAAVLIGLVYVMAARRGAMLSAAVALTILAVWGIVGGPEPIGDASRPPADNVLSFVYCFGLLMGPAAIAAIVRSSISVLRWENGLARGRQPSGQAAPARIRAAR